MITVALSLALLSVQKEAPIRQPIVPAGSNRSFQEAVIAVEESLQTGDFVEAKKRLAALPTHPIKIELDDSKIPTEMKATVREAVRKASIMWQQNAAVEATLVPKGGHLKISFDKQLPNGELGLPAGAGNLFSSDPAEPRLTTVIGLNRGNPVSPAMPNEIQNEIAHAIALYLGVDRSLRPGSVSFRTDFSASGLIPVTARELLISKKCNDVVVTLQQAVEKKVKLSAAKPKIFLEVKEVTLPSVLQGEPQAFDLQVTNNGKSPLSLFVEPDCGCLDPFAPAFVEAGETALVKVRVNTVEFAGHLKKWLYVHSNDPEFPSIDIPVSVNIDPLFQLVRPGPSILQMGDENVSAEAFLWFGEGAKIKILDARVDGITSQVEIEPWEGEMADPALGQGPHPRKGYKLKMLFQSTFIPGRSMASIVVTTDHPIFKTIRGNLAFQRGIVALPERLYLGEIERAANRSMFLVSRPSKGFKITKIETNSPFLKAVAYPVSDDTEYRVNVELTGGQDPGQFSGMVTVFTDDPTQPRIEVQVGAIVR
ncbi:MAG: DUF1573 domain-containing protein [Fimbriimonadaceae bacterium]